MGIPGAKAANETGIMGFGLRRLVRLEFPSAKAEFAGFGLQLLVSQGFIGVKAGHPDQRFGIEKLMLCANALCQNSRIRLSPNSGTVCRIFYGGIFFCFGKAGETLLFQK